MKMLIAILMLASAQAQANSDCESDLANALSTGRVTTIDLINAEAKVKELKKKLKALQLRHLQLQLKYNRLSRGGEK